MAEAILGIVLGCQRSGITSPNDDNSAFLGCFNIGIQQRFRTCSKGWEFKDPCRTVGRTLRGAWVLMRTITDPFHRMVFAERTAEWNNSWLFGPTSRPIQPSGMPLSSVAEPTWLK